MSMGRISPAARPSGRTFRTAMRSRMISFSSLSKMRWTAARRSVLAAASSRSSSAA